MGHDIGAIGQARSGFRRFAGDRVGSVLLGRNQVDVVGCGRGADDDPSEGGVRAENPRSVLSVYRRSRSRYAGGDQHAGDGAQHVEQRVEK